MPPFGDQQVKEAINAGSNYYGDYRNTWQMPESFLWKDTLVEKEDDSLADPYNVPLIGNLLEEASKKPIQKHPFSAISTTSGGKSVMDKLPQEICDAMAALMPQSDLLNLRLASRSFAHVFRNQYFWASRFKRSDRDRHWLFESHHINKPGYNWRWLYERTSGSISSMTFSNRKRVWKTVNLIKDIMDINWRENFRRPSDHAHCDESRSISAARTKPHDKLLKSEMPTESHTCCWLYRQKAKIPASVRQFKFSFAKLGKDSYITGIGFTSSKGVSSEMGYG
jgi:hypothetical protein